MISLNCVSNYCKEDISLIENYNEAINSNKQYDCHHRLETELNVSKQYLIDNNLYLNRPASELKFVTSKMHNNLHDAGSTTRFGASKGHSNKGKHLSDATKAKMSAAQKGRVGYTKGYKWKLVNGKRVYFKEEACLK